MSGISGELIGLGSGGGEFQNPIGMDQAFTDGDPSCRGCSTNFIGFGAGLTSTTQSATVQDFNAADNTVTICDSAAELREPVYTGNVLSWEEPAP